MINPIYLEAFANEWNSRIESKKIVYQYFSKWRNKWVDFQYHVDMEEEIKRMREFNYKIRFITK